MTGIGRPQLAFNLELDRSAKTGTREHGANLLGTSSF
jgi:hypothetical protein